MALSVIVVTNSALATEVDDDAVGYGQKRNWGSTTVTNTDNTDIDVEYTNRGANIINMPSGVVYGSRGATVYTNL